MQFRDFIPPVLSRTGRRAAEGLRPYNSFSEALADSDGYEAPDIIEVVRRKTKIYRDQLSSSRIATIRDPQTLQNLFVLGWADPDRPLNILELGGACGASYFEVAHLLPERIAAWNIVETPAMAACARESFHDPNLNFFDNLPAAVARMNRCDLLIAQGVLQYMPQPLETFDELLALGFKYVYVARTLTFANDLQSEAAVIFNAKSMLSQHGPGLMPAGFPDRGILTTCTVVADGSFTSRLPVGYSEKFRFSEGKSQQLVGSRMLEINSVGFLLQNEPGKRPPA